MCPYIYIKMRDIQQVQSSVFMDLQEELKEFKEKLVLKTILFHTYALSNVGNGWTFNKGYPLYSNS